MAKDILGREIAPGTPAGAYNSMARQAGMDTKNLASNVVKPAMRQGFPNVAAVAQGVQEDMAGKTGPQAAGTAMRGVMASVPAIGADTLRATGLASRAVFGPWMNAAADFGKGLFGSAGTSAPAAAPTPAVAAPAAPVAAPDVAKPADGGYVQGAGLPSREQIAKETGRAMDSQRRSDALMGITPQAQPTSINVQRQPNGVLSFSGVGGGDGTGAVRYTGMPNWTSQKGGAGMGSADFGGEAFKPAQAAIAQRADESKLMPEFSDLMGRIARGEGGPVGVAQNKIQLQALAPLVEREMAGKNATGIAKMETETRRRGQDLGLTGDMARVDASIYGTDRAAFTAEDQMNVEREKIRASMLIAARKAATGKPLTAQDQVAYNLYRGLGPDGKPFASVEQQREAERRFGVAFKGGDQLAAQIAALMAPQEQE